MKKITVRLKKTRRDGWQLEWRDRGGKTHRETYTGKRTQSAVRERIDDLEENLNRSGSARRWSDFEKRVVRSFLPGMTAKGQGKPKTMLKRFKRELQSQGLGDIECDDLSEDIILAVEERMRAEGLAAMTIRTNMGALWSMLHWGIEGKLLPPLHRPRKRIRKRDRSQASQSKGRALTLEEIERMIEAIRTNPRIRDEPAWRNPRAKNLGQPNAWTHVRAPDESAEQAIKAIHVARLIGMRLDDAHWFRWDPQPGHHYVENLGGKHPMLSFSSAQKSGQSERIPLTPMAVEYLRSIEQSDGYVCRMFGKSGYHATAGRLGRIIANAGRAANILAKPNGGKFGAPKYASAHDLRRTFGVFLINHLDKISVRDAQKMMRHASFETLMRFYSDSTDDVLSQKLASLFDKSGGFSVDDKTPESQKTP